jgi:plastocyanin
MFRMHCLPLVLSCALMSVGTAHCAEVIAHAHVTVSGGKRASNSGVVVWLQSSYLVSAAKPSHFRLVQKDKKFTPHLLVIPLGSTVDFPNLDPFFHNVFSQFNGKRFDLGLYEAGSTKTVRFDHEGVSYIFCNIHPEMSAVVIALATPYVAESAAHGSVEIRNVPDGDYELHVWAEGADTQQLQAFTRTVHVRSPQTDLGDIHITRSSDVLAHKNKFGEDYKPSEGTLY